MMSIAAGLLRTIIRSFAASIDLELALMRREHAGHVNAALALLQVGDGSGGEQRTLERTHGTDVGFGRTGADGNADAGAGEVGLRFRNDLPGFDELVNSFATLGRQMTAARSVRRH